MPAVAQEEGVAELLTQVQLAQRLGISRRTLSTWVRKRVMPMIKIRGFCHFEFAKVRAALERYEAGGRRQRGIYLLLFLPGARRLIHTPTATT